jgi:hypothetical protein
MRPRIAGELLKEAIVEVPSKRSRLGALPGAAAIKNSLKSHSVPPWRSSATGRLD